MPARQYKFKVNTAPATAMDSPGTVAPEDPPEITGAQLHRGVSGTHPAAGRSPTDKMVKFRAFVWWPCCDGRFQTLSGLQIEHPRPHQVAVVYRNESIDEVASAPGKPIAHFTIGMPRRSRREPSHAAPPADTM